MNSINANNEVDFNYNPDETKSGTVGDVFLVLSNLALIPSIYICTKYKFPIEGSILFCTFFASTIYHICLGDFFCILELYVLQASDHFFVYEAMLWITLFLIDAPLYYKTISLLIFNLGLLPFTVQYVSSWWLAGGLVGAIVLITLVALVYFVGKLPNFSVLEAILIVVLLGVGFFLHIWGGDPGQKRYAVAHTFWHLAAMAAVYFIMRNKASHRQKKMKDKYHKRDEEQQQNTRNYGYTNTWQQPSPQPPARHVTQVYPGKSATVDVYYSGMTNP